MRELAKVVGKAPSTMTEQVDRLVRKGLLTRQHHENDRRKVSIKITPIGQKIFLDMDARYQKALLLLVGKLNLKEKASCLRITEKLLVHLSARHTEKHLNNSKGGGFEN
jgi:DNA-binding MarR family transcriptional regulator